jgi:hypothetical protein
LGIAPYAVLAFIAMYRIGTIGQTGLWLLSRGLKYLLLLNFLFLVALYISGFYSNEFARIPFLPKHGVIDDFPETTTYWFGTKQGPYRLLQINNNEIYEAVKGEYKNGLKHGKWIAKTPFGETIYEREYDSNIPCGKWKEYYAYERPKSVTVYDSNHKIKEYSLWRYNGD